MSFLALTPLQALLLALATTCAVVLLYLLKLRRRRVFVSSSLLWQRVLDSRSAESLWERLRKILSILIAVMIALLIAMSLARPEIERLTGKAEHIVIVLDTSATMNARTVDGATRWQKAVQEAKTILDAGGPGTQFRVVDTSGQVDSAYRTDRNEVRTLIDGLQPNDTRSHFPDIPVGEGQVYFVSDGVSVSEEPKAVKRISVFEAANNAGITAFEIRSTPSSPLEYEAYVEVRNFGDPSDIEFTLTGEGNDRITTAIHLSGGGRFQEVYDLSRFKGGEIRASIQSPNDALPDDNVAYAYLPVKRKMRTVLVTRGNKYLEALLGLDSRIDLVKMDPRRYNELAGTDAYIFDRFAPSTPPQKPSLIIGAANAPWLRPQTGVLVRPQITTWSDSHPVMQHVTVQDISINRAMRIDPGNLTVIAASNQAPLIVVSDKPKWVMLTFDLDSSDFPLQVGFPVFIENVLAWLSRDELASYHSPGRIEVPLAKAEIRTTGGRFVPSEQQLGKTVFVANEAGLYSGTRGDLRVHAAVNIADPNISNINHSVFEQTKPVDRQQYGLHHELWFYMLLAAIVLMSVEWFTYHRRVTL